MRLPIINLGLLVLALVGLASRSNADTIITVPPGLSPGSTYELVFVTADRTTAVSGDIASYNEFVTTEADEVPALAALGATWSVIGATAAVGVVANIGALTGPIYNLAGLEVAPNSTALFNTLHTPLLNPIDITQGGAVLSDFVWTGVDVGILSDPYSRLGSGMPYLGLSSYTDFRWGELDMRFSTEKHFAYAISSPLVVGGAPVPEPTTTGLIGLGGGRSYFSPGGSNN